MKEVALHSAIKSLIDCFEHPMEVEHEGERVVRNSAFEAKFPSIGQKSIESQLVHRMSSSLDKPYANIYEKKDQFETRMHLIFDEPSRGFNNLVNEFELHRRTADMSGAKLIVFEFRERAKEHLIQANSRERFYKQGRFLQITKNFKSAPHVSFTKAENGFAFHDTTPTTQILGKPSGDFVYARRFLDRSTALVERPNEQLLSRTILVVGDSSGSGLHAASLTSIVISGLNQFLYSGGLKATSDNYAWDEFYKLGYAPMSPGWRSCSVSSDVESNPAWRLLRALHFIGCGFYDLAVLEEPNLSGVEAAIAVLDVNKNGAKSLYWANSGLLMFEISKGSNRTECRRIGHSRVMEKKKYSRKPLLVPDADQDTPPLIQSGCIEQPEGAILIGTDGLIPNKLGRDLSFEPAQDISFWKWCNEALTNTLKSENIFENTPSAAYRLAKRWSAIAELEDPLSDDLAIGLLYC